MPQAYCTECRTHVTVRQGACLAGHQVNTPLHRREPGRHAARSQSTLVVALRQVRQSLSTTEVSPDEGRHRQPGSERPTSPEVPRRPGEEQRPRWPRSGERPHRVTPPRASLASDQPAPVRPQVDGTRGKGVNSPLLELLGMAEPPTSLAGPHLPPPGRPAPVTAPAAPAPSGPPPEAPRATPLGLGRACSI